MKKIAFLCLSIMIGLNSLAQNKFEKGYYIDNQGVKVSGFIKNNDWSSNPNNFQFKINLESQESKKIINNVKEFSVGGLIYQRFNVDIDRSSNKLSELTEKRVSEFKKETLFLKILVQGSKANLYSYTDGDLRRYFYKLPNNDVKQLIFKTYKLKTGRTAKNELYKKQLNDFLPCSSIEDTPSYSKNDLKKYFIAFNNCSQIDENLTDFTLNETKGKLNLRVKAGLNYSKVTITALNTSFNTIPSESGNEVSPRFGIELEYMLPLNNNRWSIFIEPTYLSFKGTSVGEQVGFLASPDYDIEYTSIELPIGVRYYFPVKNDSNLFIDGGFALDYPMDSFVDNFEIKSDVNLFFGFGYLFKDTYSLEVRYNAARSILTNYVSFDSAYTGLSLNFGYSLF